MGSNPVVNSKDDVPDRETRELPHESDLSECEQVMRDLWLFLDNELDGAARSALQRHLDDCSPCLDESDLEGKLKKLIHRTCSGERAPDQLRHRLTAAISSVSVTSTSTTSIDGGRIEVDQVRVVRTVIEQGPAPE